MPRYPLHVNGAERVVEVDGDTALLWVLRDTLGLRGTKYGCGVGLCGICTVHLGGMAVRSCGVEISEVGAAEVTTIEGITADGPHDVQRAWIDEDVAQCGFCQTGQVMTAIALLRVSPLPTDAEMNGAMSGVLCRCGTYPRIRRAIRRAAGQVSR